MKCDLKGLSDVPPLRAKCLASVINDSFKETIEIMQLSFEVYILYRTSNFLLMVLSRFLFFLYSLKGNKFLEDIRRYTAKCIHKERKAEKSVPTGALHIV